MDLPGIVIGPLSFCGLLSLVVCGHFGDSSLYVLRHTVLALLPRRRIHAVGQSEGWSRADGDETGPGDGD